MCILSEEMGGICMFPILKEKVKKGMEGGKEEDVLCGLTNFCIYSSVVHKLHGCLRRKVHAQDLSCRTQGEKEDIIGYQPPVNWLNQSQKAVLLSSAGMGTVTLVD